MTSRRLLDPTDVTQTAFAEPGGAAMLPKVAGGLGALWSVGQALPRALGARRWRRGAARALAQGRSGTFLAGLPLVAALFLGWELAPRVGLLSPIFFPPFSEVVAALADLLRSGELLVHAGASLQRSLAGFALAAVTAIPLGLAMGRYRRFERVADLLVQSLRNTSQFALLPVFILVLGIGETSKIAITFWASIWFLLVNTITGVKQVDPLYVKAARSMGTSDLDLFRKVILPAAVPSVIAGARLGVKSSIVAVIGAEMLAAKSGLGFLVQNAQLMLQVSEMYAGILALTLIGLASNYLLVWIERTATSWRGDASASAL